MRSDKIAAAVHCLADAVNQLSLACVTSPARTRRHLARARIASQRAAHIILEELEDRETDAVMKNHLREKRLTDDGAAG